MRRLLQCVLLVPLVCAIAAPQVGAQTLPVDESFQGGALPAGFNVSDDATASRAVVFTANGAEFGTAEDGDNGRNYVRTDDTAYYTTDFTAYLTVNADPAGGGWGTSEQFFFGLGTGEVGQYGVPDRATNNDSVWVEFNAATGNDAKRWRVVTNDEGTRVEGVDGQIDYPEGLSTLVHRLMMTYHAGSELMAFGVDYDYAGGPFVADQISSVVDVSDMADAVNGWAAGDDSAIFFGGDNYTTDPEVPCFANSLTVVAGSVIPEPSGALLMLLGVLGLVTSRRR